MSDKRRAMSDEKQALAQSASHFRTNSSVSMARQTRTGGPRSRRIALRRAASGPKFLVIHVRGGSESCRPGAQTQCLGMRTAGAGCKMFLRASVSPRNDDSRPMVHGVCRPLALVPHPRLLLSTLFNRPKPTSCPGSRTKYDRRGSRDNVEAIYGSSTTTLGRVKKTWATLQGRCQV